MHSVCLILLALVCLSEQSPVKRLSPPTFPNGKTRLCWFVDLGTKNRHSGMEQYIQDVTAAINADFASNGISLTFESPPANMLIGPNPEIELGWYVPQGTPNDEKISKAMQTFWESYDLYINMRGAYECGAGILLHHSSDALWSSANGVAAVASWGGMCKNNGYILMKDKKNVGQQAALVVHELLHLMYAKHDNNAIGTTLTGLLSYPQYVPMVNRLIAECDGVTGDCQNGQGVCVEHSGVLAYSPVPDSLSDCSIAFLYFFLEIPNSAASDCIGAQSAKRELEVEEERRDDAPDFASIINDRRDEPNFVSEIETKEERRDDPDPLPSEPISD